MELWDALDKNGNPTGKTLVRGAAVLSSLKDGDKVLISRYSGTEVKLDGVEYTIVRQNDILAVVTD